MTDQELDRLLRRALLDAADQEAQTPPETETPLSEGHRRRMREMLRDPLLWFRLRNPYPWRTVARRAAVVLLINRGKPAVSDNAISLKASNASERTAFLSQFGWEIEEDPVEVAEVIIPAEFDRGYEKYNEIQKAQNLDLTPYAGKRAKRWTYNIKNYPGYEGDSGTVQANILVYEGAVIGGDICSTELDGFMQGFDFPTKNAAQNESTT